jgi:TRAP-type C4-dicarboxylate transport system substrate-binding protein
MPLNYGIMALPFVGYSSMEVANKIYWELYNKFPAMREEWAGLRLLNCSAMPPVQIHMTKKVVKLPADLKGVKVASMGDISRIVNLVGGAPVEIANIGDLYMSLERGLVEGVINHFPVVQAFGCTPLVPYHTILGEGGISMSPHCFIMNPDSWNKLPSDIQKIFDEEDAWYQTEIVKSDIGEIERAMNEGKKLNHTFTYLTPEEIKVWSDLGVSLHNEWIEKMEAKGKPARAIYEEAKRLIAQYTSK